MFKIGQKIVCINAEGEGAENLEKDKDYTVRGVVDFPGEGYGIFLKEVSVTGDFEAFDPTRFREIDFSFGESVLEKIEKEIEETFIL